MQMQSVQALVVVRVDVGRKGSDVVPFLLECSYQLLQRPPMQHKRVLQVFTGVGFQEKMLMICVMLYYYDIIIIIGYKTIISLPF